MSVFKNNTFSRTRSFFRWNDDQKREKESGNNENFFEYNALIKQVSTDEPIISLILKNTFEDVIFSLSRNSLGVYSFVSSQSIFNIDKLVFPGFPFYYDAEVSGTHVILRGGEIRGYISINRRSSTQLNIICVDASFNNVDLSYFDSDSLNGRFNLNFKIFQ